MLKTEYYWEQGADELVYYDISATPKGNQIMVQIEKNYLHFIKMYYDCDKDAILMTAQPAGPTCHTGSYSCFKENPDFSLKLLEQIIDIRKKSKSNKSYTIKLLKDIDFIRLKIIEEANEVVLEDGKQRIIEESADVIYHLMVLLAKKDISLKDIETELKKRHTK